MLRTAGAQPQDRQNELLQGEKINVADLAASVVFI